ncbi:Atrial natriuretic peptide receptor 2 [Hypsibius exemplaris]|uniref:Guanylate cyclase n=1 Tax=Hypsibius exemplaris TaxID=2072580 RepID=A0A1W0XBJ1_HYPEX|nr:Atrial natriuretic peptide receptor 2 [Hypsibius exemplaris]
MPSIGTILLRALFGLVFFKWGGVVSWTSHCNVTEFLILSGRQSPAPETSTLSLLSQQAFASVDRASNRTVRFTGWTFNESDVSLPEYCDLFVLQLATELSSGMLTMREAERECLIVGSFVCEDKMPLITSIIDGNISILTMDPGVEHHAAILRTSVTLFLRGFNLSYSALICDEDEDNNLLSSFCRSKDHPKTDVHKIGRPIYFIAPEVEKGFAPRCFQQLTKHASFSNVFIFAVSLGQFMECWTVSSQALKSWGVSILYLCADNILLVASFTTKSFRPAIHCNQLQALAIFVSTDRAKEAKMQLSNFPVIFVTLQRQLITLPIVAPHAENGTISHELHNSKSDEDAGRFYEALVRLLSPSQKKPSLNYKTTFELVMENGEQKILASVSNATGTPRLTQLVDTRSFSALTRSAGGAPWRATGPSALALHFKRTYDAVVYGMAAVLCLTVVFALFCVVEAFRRNLNKGKRKTAQNDEIIAIELGEDGKEIISADDLVQVHRHKSASRSFAYSLSHSDKLGEGTNTQVYLYRGKKVWVKQRELAYSFEPEFHHIAFLKKVKRMHHPNIATLRGIVLSPDPLIYEMKMVMEYCQRASLADLIGNEAFDFTFNLQAVLIKDIATAMTFMHNSFINCHGSLKSPNCLITDRFNVKITDYGLNVFPVNAPALESDESLYRLMLWTAPEILRGPVFHSRKGSKPGDVYSFAVILQEIVNHAEPFCENSSSYAASPKEIVRLLIERSIPAYRPRIPDDACQPGLRDLIERAWAESPQARPSFKELFSKIGKLAGFAENSSYLDYLIQRMTDYSEQLEERVHDATKILLAEKKLSDELLAQMMPKSVLDKLQMGLSVHPETFEEVTLGFSGVTQFTQFVAGSSPIGVVDFLNGLYHLFDEIIGAFDAYKWVSGLPVRNGNRHSAEVARMSLRMFAEVKSIASLNMDADGEPVRLKLGLHTGACVAGVVGLKAPRYCLFGDTINTTSRMCTIAKANEIVVSRKTKQCLDEAHPALFQLVSRGETEVKGKGMMETFRLEGTTVVNSNI